MADARIFADLKADHDRHRKLLADIAETSGASNERKTLFETFMLDVTAHAAAEEESLYATMLGMPDLRDDARHSVSEHKEIDDYLGELNDADMSSSGWLVKFKEMRHRYEHHIDEERLGRLFEERKPKELARAEAEPPTSDERE